MQIALVADSQQPADILGALESRLVREVKDLDVKRLYAYDLLDLPALCANLKGFELVCVCHFPEHDDPRASVFWDKIVDVELELGVRIVKAVESIGEEDLITEDDWETLKERLAEKWGRVVLDTLFAAERFVPGGPHATEGAQSDSGDDEDLDDEIEEDALEDPTRYEA